MRALSALRVVNMYNYTVKMHIYTVLCIFMRRFNQLTHRYAKYPDNWLWLLDLGTTEGGVTKVCLLNLT